MLLDDVQVGDVVELNTPTAGQTFYVFVYEIAEDEVRYRYGLMGASVGQCLMSNIVRVVGPDEEGIHRERHGRLRTGRCGHQGS